MCQSWSLNLQEKKRFIKILQNLTYLSMFGLEYEKFYFFNKPSTWYTHRIKLCYAISSNNKKQKLLYEYKTRKIQFKFPKIWWWLFLSNNIPEFFRHLIFLFFFCNKVTSIVQIKCIFAFLRFVLLLLLRICKKVSY